jgi:cytidylate kinase
MAEERLQKVLAQAGLGSRRACEELIQAGRVTIDGRVMTELGCRVDPALVDIWVDGQPITAERHRYIILHKPAGYLSGPDARAEYPSWEALVKVPERLYAVGRLDQDSEGLLLLTNDGELAVRLTHPRYEHAKTYLVQVQGLPNPRKIRRLQHGVMLDDGRTLPARVVLWRELPADVGQGVLAAVRQRGPATAAAGIKARPAGARPALTSWLKVTLREGRKRQLRRMVALLGHPAQRVIRIGLGPLTLGDLRPGKWRDLNAGELNALRDAVGHIPAPGDERIGVERKHRALISNTIAIDGPSASGKSTIGGLLAQELGYLYFDTGVMYRAIAAVALNREVAITDEPAVTALAEQVRIEVLRPTVSDGRDVTVLADGVDLSWDIRRPEVEKAVSPVSAYPGVREAMRVQQRRIGEARRVVMVGRDIGTVVLPDAELKIYLDASLAERARRRYLQRKARGEEVEFDRVMQDVRRRDEYDSTRQHGPLAAAPDAIVVDTTGLSVEQVIERVRGLLKQPVRPAVASQEA